jgi:hypothetical protein
MKLASFIFFLVMASLGAALAQDKPAVPPPAAAPIPAAPPDTLDELHKLRLLDAYKDIVMLQTQQANLQMGLQQLAQQVPQANQNWQMLSARTAHELGLPPGTQFQPNLQTKEVTIVKPPAAPERPAPKAEKPKDESGKGTVTTAPAKK